MSDAAMEQLFDEAVQRHQAGQAAEAEALYRRILKSDPNEADAMQMLALLALESGRGDEALELLKRAVEINPGAADYHYHLGVAFAELKKPNEAMAEFEAALAREEKFPEALLGMGKILENFGRFEEAVGVLRRAVALEPGLVEGWVHLTDVLREWGRLDEALAAGLKTVELLPRSPGALAHLAVVLHYMGRYDEAIQYFCRALEIDPTHADACSNLANALGSAWDVRGAVEFYRKSLARKPDQPRVHSNLLYALHMLEEAQAPEIFQEHLQWAAVHAQPLRADWRAHGNDRSPGRRLRVGYVSPDFRGHSVSFFIESLLANHDPAQVEIFCYSDTRNPDGVTARLKALAHKWRDTLGIDDRGLAEVIREDQIDILVDLSGHTANHRLTTFAMKPAPIQISYLGYPDTTGMEGMDYRLTDGYADPPGKSEPLYTEELVRLPRTFLCFRPPGETPEVSPLPALVSGRVTFGSLNHLPKINASVIEVWSRILKGVANSRIIIKSLTGLEYMPTRQKMLELFAANGITEDRVILHGGIQSAAEHLATYHEIDIGLDTFPYNGTTTTCEAMWMGAPVVALEGKTHAGRVGVSLLSNLGLGELIGRSVDEYVEIAGRLASDLGGLGRMRAGLRQKMRGSPLLDGRQFARDVEAAYRRLWVRWIET